MLNPDLCNSLDLTQSSVLCLHCITVCRFMRLPSVCYIPQTEQHEPEGRMLFRLGNVTNLLDVTPGNQIPHPLSPPPILHCVI